MPIKHPPCPKCEQPMVLFASWTATMLVPKDKHVENMGPITSRTFQCDTCLIPVQVDCCPKHQEEQLVLQEGQHTDIGTRAPTGEMVAVQRFRPYRCAADGCTYAKWNGSGLPKK